MINIAIFLSQILENRLQLFQDVELALLTRSLLNIVAIVLLHTRAGEVVSFSLILLQCGGVLSCSSIQQHLHVHNGLSVSLD